MEVDPNNILCSIMKREELEDLIKVVKRFASNSFSEKLEIITSRLFNVRKYS
ncbi:MAG: hypothetical protein WAZ77_08675 [Candidatus Nitrosopolaris sp.]